MNKVLIIIPIFLLIAAYTLGQQFNHKSMIDHIKKEGEKVTDGEESVLQNLAKKEYIRRLEVLDECCKSEISNMSSNGVYNVFWTMNEEKFNTMMDLNIAALMTAGNNYGKPENEYYKAKRMYYLLSSGASLYSDFNEFMLSAIKNIKDVSAAVPNFNSNSRKASEINAAHLVMNRLDRFLTSFKGYPLPFKTNFSDFEFSASDRKLVEEYYVKYGESSNK